MLSHVADGCCCARYEFGDVILGGDVPSMTEEGVNVVGGGGMEKGHNLVTSLFKTAKQQEKTVAIVTDEVTMEEYERFPALVGEAKHVKTGGSCEEVVEMGCEAAVNHNMTICHVDLGGKDGDGQSPEERMKRVKKMAKKMFGFTSLNGLFMLILGGTSKQNGMVGLALKKPDVVSFET